MGVGGSTVPSRWGPWPISRTGWFPSPADQVSAAREGRLQIEACCSWAKPAEAKGLRGCSPGGHDVGRYSLAGPKATITRAAIPREGLASGGGHGIDCSQETTRPPMKRLQLSFLFSMALLGSPRADAPSASQQQNNRSSQGSRKCRIEGAIVENRRRTSELARLRNLCGGANLFQQRGKAGNNIAPRNHLFITFALTARSRRRRRCRDSPGPRPRQNQQRRRRPRRPRSPTPFRLP